MKAAIKPDISSIQPDATPRKMNEIMNETLGWPTLTPLFDQFWREGELALMFGPSGAGKSIFAVQLADALARGSAIDGFAMPSAGKRVLYVDLQGAEFQFRTRYSDASGRRYNFSERLLCARPPVTPTNFIEWLRSRLEERRFDVVIIDDIDSLRRTNGGTSEVLAAMRALKRLRDEMMVSILVIAEAREAKGKQGTEKDLGTSRVLCTVADNVFSLSVYDTGHRRLIQTRSRNAPVFWTRDISPIAQIAQLRGGLLGFQFDERFVPGLTDEENELLQDILPMRETAMTYRQIAAVLSISKTRAHRLVKKHALIKRLREIGPETWKRLRRREMFVNDGAFLERNSEAVDETFPGCEEFDEARKAEKFDALYESKSDETSALRAEYYDLGLARREAFEEYRKTGHAPTLAEMMERIRTRRSSKDAEASPTLSPEPPKPKTIFDLPVVVDRIGRKMYIEIEEHHTRRPKIFYTVNPRSGQVTRWMRRGWGIFGTLMKDENLPTEHAQHAEARA
jgi:hypothetical protein